PNLFASHSNGLLCPNVRLSICSAICASICLLTLSAIASLLMTRNVNRNSRKGDIRAAATSTLPSGAASWVKKTLKKMTLEEKLGQLMMIPFFGGFTPTDSEELRELLRQIEHNHIGGLMLATCPGPIGLLRSRAYPSAVLINLLQNKAKLPLLIAA